MCYWISLVCTDLVSDPAGRGPCRRNSTGTRALPVLYRPEASRSIRHVQSLRKQILGHLVWK